MAAQGFRIMDADGHIMEPAGMWERYITPAFRERAPRVVRGADGRSRIVVGAWPARATRETTASAPMREAFAVRTRQLLGEYARADYDSESQIRAVGASGVDVAFLYPTQGLYTASIDALDPALAIAICRAYNDWIGEFCAHAPKRLYRVK